MAQSTIALLALAHTANRSGGHADGELRSPPPGENPASTTPSDDDATVQPLRECDAVRTIPALTTRPEQFAELATRMCARDPGRRRDPDLVVRILTRHHLDGWSPTQIAEETNRSRSTVSRIISEAAQMEASEHNLLMN